MWGTDMCDRCRDGVVSDKEYWRNYRKNHHDIIGPIQQRSYRKHLLERRASIRTWGLKHLKEKEEAYVRRYHADSEFRERRKTHNREWRRTHQEANRTRKKQYYLKNRGVVLLRKKQYRLTHRTRILEYNHRHYREVREQYLAKHALLKKRAIDKLGGKCIKCGNVDIRVLQINHKNGCGTRLRPNTRKLYLAIIHGTTDFSVLEVRCANCNIIYEYERGRLKLRVSNNVL